MQQKICISKKITLLVGVGIIFLLAVVTLNNLTQQKTSTNSRASERKQTSVSGIPTAIPTPTISCNQPGKVLVRDSFTKALWSWGSVSVNGNGSSPCQSKIYVGSPPPSVTPILFPREAFLNGFIEYFVNYNSTPSRKNGCYRYGTTINMTSNPLIYKVEDLTSVPQELVASKLDNNVKCAAGSLKTEDCMKTYRWINNQCWHIRYSIKTAPNRCISDTIAASEEQCERLLLRPSF